MALGLWDYVTCVFLLVATCCVGMYHTFTAKKVKNAREFLFNSPDLGIFPIISSSVATFVSGILLTGFPAETYTNGIIYIAIGLSLLLLAPFITHLYFPIFYNLGSKTVFEYLEYRFHRRIRLLASVLFNIQMILFTAVAIYAPSLALNQVTGLSFWGSVLTIGAVCILYTSLGGIKAVVWADTAQAVIITVTILIVIIKGCIDVGGISEMWRICSEGQRTILFKFHDDGRSYYTMWTMVVGGTIHMLGFLGTNQMLMQRYLSNPSLARARGCFIGSITLIALIAAMSAFCGLVMYAKYSTCDPLLDRKVTSRDQIMALFSVETLSFMNGLPGVFVAGLLCATLSTLSSCLNSVAAVIIEDYVRPYKPDMRDATIIKLSKITAILLGVICIAAVAVAQSVGGVVKAVFSMVGMVGGPVLALFTIGMVFPWANSWGAFSGFITAVCLTGWASVGGIIEKVQQPTAPMTTLGCNSSTSWNMTELRNVSLETLAGSSDMPHSSFYIYTLSPLWYASWSCALMLTIGVAISLITGPQDPEKLDPNLIFPIVWRVLGSLPENLQVALGLKNVANGRKKPFKLMDSCSSPPLYEQAVNDVCKSHIKDIEVHLEEMKPMVSKKDANLNI